MNPQQKQPSFPNKDSHLLHCCPKSRRLNGKVPQRHHPLHSHQLLLKAVAQGLPFELSWCIRTVIWMLCIIFDSWRMYNVQMYSLWEFICQPTMAGLGGVHLQRISYGNLLLKMHIICWQTNCSPLSWIKEPFLDFKALFMVFLRSGAEEAANVLNFSACMILKVEIKNYYEGLLPNLL